MNAGRRAEGRSSFGSTSGVHPSAFRLRPEALAVLDGRQESLDQFRLAVVAAEVVELGEPEVVALEARVRRSIRVAPQIPEILHQHERPVELGGAEVRVLRDAAQYAGARLAAVGEARGEVGDLGR